ncbi:hypothetical protein ACFOVU_19005 [Nocardiopsis sediminis]|uniref:DUF3093 domain-containing protein n=1 Tax=Nocardiopsis sediminis TaxID=1778267 RepID=A0ABV8FTH2_9ACTN
MSETSPSGWPRPGDPGVTVFTPSAGAAAYLRYLLPWAAVVGMLFVVILLLGSILFETLAEGTGTVAGVACGLVAAAIATLSLGVKVRRMLTGTVVTSSPVGVELRDSQGFEVRMRWPDVTAVGTVLDRQGPRTVMGRPVFAGPIRVEPAVIRSHGLIGWGERVVPPSAPAALRHTLASQPRDPATGLVPVAVSFSAAGEPDLTNPLLTQAQHFRPDLFA